MPGTKLKSLLAIGLVSSAMLFGPIASAQAPQTGSGYPDTRYVKGSAVNVRGGPGTHNRVLMVLNLGAEVSIYVIQGDWARISGPGQPEQWIYAPLLQSSRPPAPSQKHNAKAVSPARPDAQPVTGKTGTPEPTHKPTSQQKQPAGGTPEQPDDKRDRSPGNPR